jgi:hypothetical protein
VQLRPLLGMGVKKKRGGLQMVGVVLILGNSDGMGWVVWLIAVEVPYMPRGVLCIPRGGDTLEGEGGVLAGVDEAAVFRVG